ncbi:MAG: HD domain-containing protein, partial [Desulfovibrionaceae bacterium]|nr:HD domain-containing protein [Desulfovibrionaceae bacterium]
LHISIRIKLALLLCGSLLLFGALAATMCYRIYIDASIEQNIKYGEGVVNLVANEIDPNRIDEFLKKGRDAAGYNDIENKLYKIRHSSINIKYIYVYRILEDGCHVVFDLNYEEDDASQPGSIQPFDESFAPYISTLIAGGHIDPIISDDTYGWLLTTYLPIYDKNGKCQCYAAVDISMDWLTLQAHEFLLQLIYKFTILLVIILIVVILLSHYKIIKPLNSMTKVTSSCKFSSSTLKELDNFNIALQQLNIRTRDEIQTLYTSFVRMTNNLIKYVKDVHKQNEKIAKMQHAFIVTLADMVENRDSNTGQHIRKTAAYTKIILNEMKRQGFYKDQLTDRFIHDVVSSAPLHDLGKIKVSDAILNKPGKLTDEEFAIMKSHTTAGGEIIENIIAKLPDPDYLYEAKNLAVYHHEKWNGAGYPSGLKGEQIPLSARVMAVADVFDALVSARCYKKGFPLEKAFAIIREERGKHFDPLIVDAFFAVQDSVIKIAQEFDEQAAIS